MTAAERFASARSVRRALVMKGDRLAGFLERDPDAPDEIDFRYDPDYVAAGGRRVATTLPVGDVPFRARGGAVPAFFAGLLPEGRRLEALVAAVKTSPDDELSLLVSVGGDCVGDVRVLPAEGRFAEPVVELRDPSHVCFHELFERSVDPEGVTGRHALPGVQEKVSAAMLSLPVKTAGAQAMLKLTPPRLPRLVENEAHMLRLAAACGLAVPKTHVLTDRDGHTGLLVSRFDRRTGPGGVERIAQEDAVQLAGRWPASKYLLSTREVFDAVFAVTPAKQAAALTLLRLFVFSYAIGNGDLHGKNVSVHAPDGDLWQLTPAYDLVSTVPYGDERMALKLDGRDDRIPGSTFVAFGERVGVPSRATRRLLHEVVDRLGPLVDTVEHIGLDDRRTSLLVRTVHRRLADLTRV